MYDKIIISVLNDRFHQIIFFNNGLIEFVEPYEVKHHMEYLPLEITEFQFLQS
jgi:hypothetical protein